MVSLFGPHEAYQPMIQLCQKSLATFLWWSLGQDFRAGKEVQFPRYPLVYTVDKEHLRMVYHDLFSKWLDAFHHDAPQHLRSKDVPYLQHPHL